MEKITVVIPHRTTEDASQTLNSLAEQTFKDFKTVVQSDNNLGANWARNEGFKQCDTEFVLFSDNDISWKDNAIEVLYQTLQRFRRASYSYGRFEIDRVIWGHQMFDPIKLRLGNYISTMSLIRSDDFRSVGGFDETLKGYQDWDLWLSFLAQGKRGAYCNELIFTTEPRNGISANRDKTMEAARAINDKHDLKLARFNTGYL